jgi:hypothetical protein
MAPSALPPGPRHAAFHQRRLAFSREGDHFVVQEANLAPAK